LPSTRQADGGKEQRRALIWLVRAFSLTGILSFAAVMWIQSWHAVSSGVMFVSAAWAGLALWVPTFRMLLRKQARSRAIHEGFDVCTACWSTRALQPEDQHCPECGAPRACSVCKHRIESDQRACPECGRAVWGRASRETVG
jgi:RNA polymerase subunit RPABC4/transcription elongation factor Spt4